jgi:hypothetical protein
LRETLARQSDTAAAEHADELKQLDVEYGKLRKRYEAELKLITKRMKVAHKAIEERLHEVRIETVWPEPEDGDDDDDPLYDSTRNYLEQMDRYKQHQDKPTTRRNQH